MSKLKSVILCLIVSAFSNFISPAFAATPIIQNDVFWKDMSGNPIYSQGGGVIKVGDIWYWYGAKYNGAVTYYSNPTKKNGDIGFLGVTCYSSKDLVNWKSEGIVFTGSFGWFGRLGVVYNKNTKNYVLIAQESMNRVVFATSSTPTGKFTQKGIQVPPGVVNEGTGDQTVFQDDDGKAYIICSSKSGRSNLYVIPLRESDFLSCEQAVRIYKGSGREGNCMFKYRGRYYFCSSDLHGWNTSHCYYISATNILGPYSSEAIMVNSERDFCHVTQTGFFITVNGTKDTTVLFCGDRWSDFAGNGIGYNQWCPVTFNGTTPVFNSLSQYEFDAYAGTWKVASGNNYILNPGFEADRVIQKPLAGWANAQNASGSRYSGRFCLQQSSSGTVSQDINNLPEGIYELKAWVQSSGGQNSAKIYISGFGGAEMNYSINKKIDKWTEICIKDIAISNGKCQVGITSANNGSNWLKVDDLSLIQSSIPVTVKAQSHLINNGLSIVSANNTIKFSCPQRTARIEMFAPNGKIVISKDVLTNAGIGQFVMPKNQFVNGRYFLKLSAGGNTKMKMINIMK